MNRKFRRGDLRARRVARIGLIGGAGAAVVLAAGQASQGSTESVPLGTFKAFSTGVPGAEPAGIT